MTEDKAPASRRASRLHHRRVMRVASPPEYFAGDGVVGPVTPLHDLQRTGSISATGSRVPAKKTHSMLSLCDEDDDEGKIVSDGSASTELSSKSSVKPTVGPPPRSLSWRNYLAVRGWLHEVSFEDVLPMVALTMALGALVFTVVILGRRSASRGGPLTKTCVLSFLFEKNCGLCDRPVRPRSRTPRASAHSVYMEHGKSNTSHLHAFV
ncbi:hypothetical protein MRX96_009473 [Rhipicephalus microplus]